MQVGDLVVQVGWEADGAGIVLSTRAQRYATVLWPGGEVEMLLSDLEVINASR
tara:strand:+ start:5750 stop:5908 length:159 start_codon:yes stop_codon:yes gene_type:complete